MLARVPCRVRSRFRYRDEVELEPSNDPIGHMDSIESLDGQISYLWGDNRYRLTVYGKNLTDKQELAQGTIHPLITRGWWTPPRTIGAEFADLLLRDTTKHEEGAQAPFFVLHG